MASITSALERIKGNPLFLLTRSVIEKVCRKFNHEFRDRELDPATTVAMFLQQIVRGNVSCTETLHATGAAATAQAYCKARARIPLAVYQGLLNEVIDAALPATRKEDHLWKNQHRTFHIDGSTVSMPDTPELRKAFGTPSGQKPGCGFPVAHLLVLFSAAAGLLLDVFMSPLRTGDMAKA